MGIPRQCDEHRVPNFVVKPGTKRLLEYSPCCYEYEQFVFPPPESPPVLDYSKEYLIEPCPPRLTRTLSAPKRCATCSKMVYFTGIRCKQCGAITHDACAAASPHICPSSVGIIRRNSAHHRHTPAASPLPTEQTRTADVNQDVDLSWRYSSLGHEVTSASPIPPCCTSDPSPRFVFTPEVLENAHLAPPTEATTPKSPRSPTMMGLLKVVHWLAQRRRGSQSAAAAALSKANAADKPAKCHFGLHEISHHEEGSKLFMREKFKSLGRTAKVGSQPTPTCQCGTSSTHQSAMACYYYRKMSLPSTTLSPNGSTASSGYISAASSTLQTPSDGELIRFRTYAARRHFSKGGDSLSAKGRAARHYMSKTKTLSADANSIKPTACTTTPEKLCATWPPMGHPTTTDPDELVEEPQHFASAVNTRDYIYAAHSDDRDIVEWCIPYRDLELKERLRHGRDNDIYTGKWHGEVLIYTYKDEDKEKLLCEVKKLSMIRHENIALFMGACMEQEHLAIITSTRKGPSLYEHIHLKQYHLSFSTKVNISRQIAQGMGYLHAKGILLRHLTSKNVILETRVRICIMDQGIAEVDKDRQDYGCIPKGHLAYWAPELMRHIRIQNARIVTCRAYDEASDVYAFGTLLYELFVEKFPFAETESQSIIWQVATGRTQPLDNVQCIVGLKALMEECWSFNPQERPGFSLIGKQLQENATLHRRHSSSEPDRLHHTGLTSGRSSIGCA